MTARTQWSTTGHSCRHFVPCLAGSILDHWGYSSRGWRRDGGSSMNAEKREMDVQNQSDFNNACYYRLLDDTYRSLAKLNPITVDRVDQDRALPALAWSTELGPCEESLWDRSEKALRLREPYYN